MLKPVSSTELNHYVWGGNCDGWKLLDGAQLTVTEERVPPGGGEIRHYHRTAEQFFFVLAGRAHIETDEGLVVVRPGEGVHVPPRVPHRLANGGDGEEELRFLVISAPTTRGDRVDLL